MSSPTESRAADDGTPVTERPLAMRWPVRASLLVVGALLLSVLVLHLVVERYLDGVREAIAGHIVPARVSTQAIRAAVSGEMAALRGYALLGDPTLIDGYAAATARERRHFEQLELLTTALGEPWIARVGALRAAAAAWHERVTASGILSGADTVVARAATVLRPSADEAFLAAAAAFGSALTRLEEERWNSIASVARFEIGLTLTLVSLTLGLVVSQGVVTYRAQRLTESLRRREREERAFREIARALSAAADPDEVAATLARGTRALTGSHAAYVERVLGASGEVTVAATDGVGAPPVGACAPFPGSLTDRMLRHGEPMYFRTVDEIEAPMASQLAKSCPGCGALVLPLAADSRGLGALGVLRAPGQRPFFPDEFARLRIVADFASLALLRVILIREAEARGEEEARHAELAERQRSQIERLMQGKAKFIRGFSHDLKNPLGAIIGYADLLAGEYHAPLAPEQKRSVERIRQAAEASLGLIRDLVDLSRAEAGQLRLDRRRVDIGPLVREAAEAYRAQAAAARLSLDVAVPDDLPRAVVDPDRVRQILGNLLSNAVEYTMAGGVVRVAAEARRAEIRGRAGDWVAVAVSDTGPGIPEQDRERIFEEFTRGRPSEGAGAGLGLAISRRLARLMDGDVTLWSEVGRGSTFTLWLPVAAPG